MATDDRDETQKVNQRPSKGKGFGSRSPIFVGRKPQLYLERTPSAAKRYSEEEFDEMIPEFMHRDFYRSSEGEFEAVQAAGRLKSSRLKSRSREDLEPIRDAAPRPKSAQQPLTPLRQNSPEEVGYDEEFLEEEPETRSEGASLRSPRSDRAGEPTGWPPPPRSSSSNSVNIALAVCLMLIVGVFLWREQTRPQVPTSSNLPLPDKVEVVRVEPDKAGLEATSPYPEMTPAVAPATEENPVEPPPVETEALAEEGVDSPPSPDTTTYPETTDEAASQRAAILERMSEGTVSRSDRETRIESASPPPADPSLFPEQPVVSERPKPQERPRTRSKESPDESLFPSETVEPPSVAEVPPAAVKKPQPVKKPVKPNPGERYQIAEPEL